MKKFLIPFVFIALVAIVATSCRKSCNCYLDGKLSEYGNTITSKERCEERPQLVSVNPDLGEIIDRVKVECKWE